MSEIVTVKGEQYLIKDGIAYPVKAGNNTNTKRAVKKADSRQEITMQEKVNLIKDMSTKQAIEWFGNTNRKKPLDISASGFWKLYQMPKGKSHYFTHDEKRLYILPRQIIADNLGKKAIVETWINAKAQLQEKIQGWENSEKSAIAKENAIASLNRQIGEFDRLIHGA